MRTLALSLLAISALSASDLQLWYNQPAVQWEEALPVGNGRLGAMVFGRPASERIQFNEHTVWTGEPHSYAHPGAHQYLGQIRSLLAEGKQKEAQALAMQEFMSQPIRQKSYQAFGDLLIEQPGIDPAQLSAYRRSLDLDTAIATTTFTANGVTYTREVLASHPAGVIAVRLTASKPRSLTFDATLKAAHPDAATTSRPDSSLSMSGAVANSAIKFEARLVAIPEGGKVESKDGRISIHDADAVTLLLAGATNFVNYRDVSASPARRNDATLAPLRSARYPALKAAHLADHQTLFRRVRLDLGSSASAALPTDERVRRFATAPDPQLVTLVFQYGRYLLIASSRKGGQPANLQGLWNASNTPSWDSKYTVNINTEMNYWPAEITGLGECQQALFDALKEVAASGAETAKEHYNAPGWVLHHNFDLWRGTAPINASDHGIWPTGGAWLSTHLWEQYLFTGDREFLRTRAYPLMKGAAEFFTAYLVRDPKSGKLISGPSNSPEQGGLVMGPTMDHQIIRALFADTASAAEALNVDPEFRRKLLAMRADIAPNHIGKHGQLQEWMEDIDDPKNEHRHVSHLWGVYPGREITPYGSPDLFAAARKSLEFRGDAATGWSMGWKLNLWARFLDGDHAWKIFSNLISPAANGGRGVRGKAGLFPNLFDAHPPFQIDGNFGATAAVAEMLLQSHDPYATPQAISPVEQGKAAFIHLLPALPSALPKGKALRLRARGGVDVDLDWADGKLRSATLHARRALPVTVRYAGKEIRFQAAKGKDYSFDSELNAIKPVTVTLEE
ncbi:MAG: glycoside hydrolase family 95 protein [Acidobacteria bacterium]|nr:glycoside hydrolase family 95 protein [Acidobacteriota bacterium]